MRGLSEVPKGASKGTSFLKPGVCVSGGLLSFGLRGGAALELDFWPDYRFVHVRHQLNIPQPSSPAAFPRPVLKPYTPKAQHLNPKP